MKISKLFTNWFTKTGKEDKTKSREDYFQKRREIIEQEHQRLKQWRKEIKQRMSYKSTYNSSIGHIPGNTITTSNLYNNYSNITVGDSISHTGIKVDGSLEVQGRDILKELDEMRDALLLLKRDVDMEAKYPRLRELKDEYEKQLEKYKTFETIKESK